MKTHKTKSHFTDVALLRGKVFKSFAASFVLIMFVFIVSGCVAVGPDYVRPDTPISNKWNALPKTEGSMTQNDEQNLSVWWTSLNDAQLTNLIDRAVKGNLDFKKAKARIREARASRGLAQASFFPTVDASGNAAWNQSGNQSGSGAGADLYSVGFDAAWELDVFGGVRRQVEAAQATLEASEENRRNVLVSSLSEVAINYVDVRINQARVASAKANLKSQEETYQLTVWRNQAGLSDALAVEQARLNLENTRSKIPSLNTGLAASMNRIAVLLGEQPGLIHAELAEPKAVPVVSENIAVGAPIDIVRRRPDIRKAERDLAAQTAKVGVAMADLYPKFKISGTIGFDAFTVGSLFTSGNLGRSIASGITIPIFAGGAIRKNIEVQSAIQEQNLIAYETSILNALEEVENALVAFYQEQSRRQSLGEGAAAAKKAAELARIKYESGLTDFTAVLDAQRSLLSAQDEALQSEGKVTVNLVRLYKALGGGWTSAANDMERQY